MTPGEGPVTPKRVPCRSRVICCQTGLFPGIAVQAQKQIGMGGVRDLRTSPVGDYLSLPQFGRHNCRAFRLEQMGQPLGDYPVDVRLGQLVVAAFRSRAGFRDVSGVKADNEAMQGLGIRLCAGRGQRKKQAQGHNHSGQQPGQQCALPGFDCSEDGKQSAKANTHPQTETVRVKQQCGQPTEQRAEWEDEQPCKNPAMLARVNIKCRYRRSVSAPNLKMIAVTTIKNKIRTNPLPFSTASRVPASAPRMLQPAIGSAAA